MENTLCSEICNELMHPDWIGKDKIESPDKLIYAFDIAWCVWHYEDMKERL